MHLRLCVLSAMLLSPFPGVAQGLPLDILNLTTQDPNAFVLEVQKKLEQKRQYNGPLNGQLNAATIKSINQFCASVGISSECRVGPLSERGSLALVKVLFPAPMLEAVQLEWTSRSNHGLTVELAEVGSVGGITAKVSGTASGSGWANIEAAKPIPVNSGQSWQMEVEVTAQDISSSSSVTARIAVIGEGGRYLGELIEAGTQIVGPGVYMVQGNVPEGAVLLRPYIQIKTASGEVVDGDFTITGAAAGRIQ